jgi:2,4-dienoyl-CoA reductase-like NADH-dependent reductase (Old Yellow Enzyme family)
MSNNKIMEQKKYIKPTNNFTFKRTGHVVRNRTVLAAMTNKQSYKDGTLSNIELNWLLKRAEGHFGIITTAAAHVSKRGQGWKGEIGIFSDDHIENLEKLTSGIRNYGSLSLMQLFHGGMRSPQHLTGLKPISASQNKTNDSLDGITISATIADIKSIINDFTASAVRCFQAGFDGVELHGAHGYLLSQFLGSKTNRRSDEWGGDIAGRTKIVLEIFRSIKEKVPESFIVGIRISPEIKKLGIHLNDSLYLVEALKNEGIDFIHISCWNIYAKSTEYPKNSNTLTEWFTKTIDDLPPVITTGNIWSCQDAFNALNQGADLLGVARVGIAYPDWPKKLFSKEYNPKKSPYSFDKLKKAGLGDVFIEYMRLWKGFVLDES